MAELPPKQDLAEELGDGAPMSGGASGPAGRPDERPAQDAMTQSSAGESAGTAPERVEPERSGVVRVRRPRYQTTPATPHSIIEELRKAGQQKPSS